MWVDPHWSATCLAALRATLDVDARTRNEMIQFLLDEGFWDAERLSWDGAVARWNDCLNPGKPAFFKLAELWALMKRFERHDLFLAMAHDLGYDAPRRIPTEERRLQLLERMAAAVETCEATLATARTELARMHHVQTSQAPVARAAGGAVVRFRVDEDAPQGPGNF